MLFEDQRDRFHLLFLLLHLRQRQRKVRVEHSLVDIVVSVGVDAESFRTGELNALAVSIMWGQDAVGSGIVNFATNVPLMLWIREELNRRVHLLLGLIGGPPCDHRQRHVKRLLVPLQRSFDASSTIQILFSRVAFGRSRPLW